MRTRWLVGIVLVGFIILGIGGSLPTSRTPPESSQISQGTQGFLLAPPAYAQGAPQGSLRTSEIGISAYVDTGQEINLASAEALFRVKEDSSADYIVGTIELAGLSQDLWPHAYISKTGWILVYYPSIDPASKMVQWYGYQRDVISTTTLRDGLISLSRNLALDVGKVDVDLRYYDFRYPSATKLLVVVDTTDATHTFSYTIPQDLSVLGASFSHYANNVNSYYSNTPASTSKVDSSVIASTGAGTYTMWGALQANYLTPGSTHRVDIGRDTAGWAGIALVFIYR